MPSALRRELWSIAAIALLLYAGGKAVGYPGSALLIGMLAYIAWHLLQALRLERRLRCGKRIRLPEVPGLWGEVHYQFYRLQQRHRKRKRKLAELLSRYQQSTAALPDATVVIGAKGEIEWWNNAAEQVLGLRPGQDIGQRIDNLVRHPDFSRFLAAGDYTGRVKVPSPLIEHIVLMMRIIPYAGDRRLVIARDITHIEHLEEVRRDFVANVSHELRTPLTVIAGFLETLLDSEDHCAMQWRGPLAQMQQQTLRMQRIVSDLLLLARLESGQQRQDQQRTVDIDRLLQSVLDDAKTLSGPRRHNIQLTAQDVSLRGNEEELRSAFSNLVFNAVQYTPAEGSIAIDWREDATGAHLCVHDTGPGIDEQHIPRLTERFYRVEIGRSRTHGGTGLGLAIVKHVLQRHDGELRIESEIGKGSVFCCDFPPTRLVVSAPSAS